MQNGGFVNKIQGVRLSVAKIHRHVFENPGYNSNKRVIILIPISIPSHIYNSPFLKERNSALIDWRLDWLIGILIFPVKVIWLYSNNLIYKQLMIYDLCTNKKRFPSNWL